MLSPWQARILGIEGGDAQLLRRGVVIWFDLVTQQDAGEKLMCGRIRVASPSFTQSIHHSTVLYMRNWIDDAIYSKTHRFDYVRNLSLVQGCKGRPGGLGGLGLQFLF